MPTTARKVSLKKCATCGHWNETTGEPEARCTKCGEYIEPALMRPYETPIKKKFSYQLENVFVVNIHPGDNFLVRGIKRLIQGGQIVFMGIVSFLIWLVALISG